MLRDLVGIHNDSLGNRHVVLGGSSRAP
ncbi:MAG: hypothetical protein QOC66_3810, partial [Pseudonocardiales bacterium]|nr:hypothetical protein [Pseudonocardiales bacterium]